MDLIGAHVSEDVVWGLFTRGLGIVFFCAFLSLARQITDEAGRSAGIPVARKLAAIRRDFPGWRRWAYFPTLLWLADSEAALRSIAWGGVLASMLVVYGGPPSCWAMLACYTCYLSLDVAIGLIFPWECLLFESAVFALFLPATHALPDVRALHPPTAAIAWAYRLLLFRVMFGFGKQKFVGSNVKDLVYLKSFLINQPLPSPLGWYAQKLPAWLLRIPLMYMLVVELVVPFFMFFTGRASVLAAASIALLQLGIQLAGNYSFFNLLTFTLCLPLLDNVTPTKLALGALFSPGAPRLVNAFVVLHTLASLLMLPLNSWVAQTWMQWSGWYRQKHWQQWPVRFLRALHPLRWLHPYGVFAPNNQPSVKVSLLVEASWDGQQWHELEFRHSPSNAKSAPRFVAPHHPRSDQAAIYEAFGLNSTSLISSVVGPFDPYAFGAHSAASMLMQRIVEGRGGKLVRDASGADRSGPPLMVRMTTIMLEPVPLRQHLATGEWWKRTYLGPHSPPRERDPAFADDLLPEPELWHFEAIAWRQRCPMVRELMRRARQDDQDPLQLVLFGAEGLSSEDVARFWDELVPLVRTHGPKGFDALADLVQAMRARWDRRQRRALFRLLGRFSLLLLARWEPLYLGRGSRPAIAAESYFQLGLLAHHVIGEGRDAFLSALRDPSRANAELAALTPLTGLRYLAAFRFESMVMEAQKLRMLFGLLPPYERETREGIIPKPAPGSTPEPEAAGKIAKLISGFFDVMPVLRDNFRGPRFDLGYAEVQPTFRELRSNEIVVSDPGRPGP
jgi:hypothetical protein